MSSYTTTSRSFTQALTALTADEVRKAVADLGVPSSAVRTTSDRHWTLACVKP